MLMMCQINDALFWGNADGVLNLIYIYMHIFNAHETLFGEYFFSPRYKMMYYWLLEI
jgi:hypothetical protein